MEVGDVIELDNNEKYSLLKEIEYMKGRYFLAAFVKEDETVDENKIVYLKHISEDGEDYVDMILSEKLIYELSKLVTEKKD